MRYVSSYRQRRQSGFAGGSINRLYRLFRSLPYARPNELLMLRAVRAAGAGASSVPGAAPIAASESGAVVGVAGVTTSGLQVPLDPDDPPWNTLEVTENILSVLGVQPTAGRSFTAGDGARLPVRVGLISHGAWQRRFAGSEAMLGRIVRFQNKTIETGGARVGRAVQGMESLFAAESQPHGSAKGREA